MKFIAQFGHGYGALDGFNKIHQVPEGSKGPEQGQEAQVSKQEKQAEQRSELGQKLSEGLDNVRDIKKNAREAVKTQEPNLIEDMVFYANEAQKRGLDLGGLGNVETLAFSNNRMEQALQKIDNMPYGKGRDMAVSLAFKAKRIHQLYAKTVNDTLDANGVGQDSKINSVSAVTEEERDTALKYDNMRIHDLSINQ